MPSSRLPRTNRRWAQSGFGLVDALVGVALIGIALVFILGSIGSLLIGARIGERRTVEQRLARNEIELVLQQSPPPACSAFSRSSTLTIKAGENYRIVTTCVDDVAGVSGLIDYRVVVSDAGDPTTGTVELHDRRVRS